MRDGQGIREHVQRFAPGGTYHRMVEQGHLKEYAVLDFRSTSTGPPRHVNEADMLPNLRLVRVNFSANFTKAKIKFSKGGQCQREESVIVGGDGAISSTCSGVQVKVRSV